MALLACFAWMGQNGPIGRRGFLFSGIYVVAFLAWLLVWCFWRPFRGQLGLLFGLAVAARLLMFPFPVGDDIPRYVWEGKIQNHGFDPYSLAPDAAELRHLRDANWEGINHKWSPGVYPPLAQLVFRATAAVSEDPRALKVVFLVADLVTLLLLAALGRVFGLEPRHLVLYGLNPLVLLYVAGEAHLDPLYLVLLVAALLAAEKDRPGLAFVLLGLSAMGKLIALLFLPHFVCRRNVRWLPLFFLPFALALPYASGLSGGVAVLGTYVRTFYYNGFVFSLLRPLVGHVTAIGVSWSVFVALLLGLVFLVPNVLRASYFTAGLLLLTMPTVHQWYFLLVVVFLPFFRSPGWILLCGTVAATFATRIALEATGKWYDFGAARFIEYAPLVVASVLGVARERRLGPWRFGAVESVSVVIPTLDEGERLEACVAALEAQRRLADEIIVVDGGSTDQTLEKAGALVSLRVLVARGGRGVQIAAGVAAARGDVVLVLHADSRLTDDCVGRMVDALNAHREAVGGAFEGGFASSSRALALVAWLNGFRARHLGLAFGDQGQFFRRSAVDVPAYALMEDVELSLRLQEAGAVLCLRGGPVSSPRRWQKRGALRNSARVVALVGEFLIRRRLGLFRDGGASFYRRYYGRSVPG